MGSTVKKIALLSGGGDCPGLNAVIRTITKTAISKYGYEVIGFVYGYRGLYHNNYVELTEESVEDIYKEGGTILYSSNKDNLFDYLVDDGHGGKVKKDVSDVAVENLKKYGVDVLVILGGDGTLTSARDFSRKGVNVIGVPKTMDNDLASTDVTYGFISAMSVGTEFIDRLQTTAKSHHRVICCELMGRDAGWLTAASALARNEYNTAPHLIYLPEVPFDKEDFLLDVKRMLFERNNVIIAVSEGIRDASGNYISASEQSVDTFGHSQLSGAGKTLEFLIKEKLGVKVRSIEVNVLQRCASHLASKTDLEESVALGKKAVALSLEGVTASMVTLNRVSNDPYTIEYGYAEIKNIANEAKSVPREWINDAGNDVTQEMIDYLTPLIQGESNVVYKNGLPVYANVAHLTQTT